MRSSITFAALLAGLHGRGWQAGLARLQRKAPLMVIWIRTTMVDDHKNIHIEDMDLIALVDEPSEAVKVIDDFYNKYLLSPNF